MKICALIFPLLVLSACETSPGAPVPIAQTPSSSDSTPETCSTKTNYGIHKGASITWRVQKTVNESETSTITGTTGISGILHLKSDSLQGAHAAFNLASKTTESGNALRDSRLEDIIFGGSTFQFELTEIHSDTPSRSEGESKIVTIKGTLFVAGQSTPVEMQALLNETKDMITVTPAEIFTLNIRSLEPSANGLNLVSNLTRLLALVPGVQVNDEVAIDFSLELFPSCEQPEPVKPKPIPKPEPAPEPEPEEEDLPDLTPDQPLPTEEDLEIQLGLATFNSRCAGCHAFGPDLYKQMKATDILDHYAQNFPTHRLIQWPNEKEAYAIEKALK